MYQLICGFENLWQAFLQAKKAKRYQYAILKFNFLLEENLLKLQNQLLKETYLPLPYKHFQVFEPKQRFISAPAFKDRVVQNALCRIIEPILEKSFIYDSYACRKNKGTHFGLKRIKKFLMAARCFYGKEAKLYFLKMDVKKYFNSIDWDILLRLIKRKIVCLKTNRLIEKFVTRHIKGGKGMPIGNLTSQLFANVYLSELDHFVKEKLKVRWYGRYMDDFVIIDADKKGLKKLQKEIGYFLKDELKLKLHPCKTFISSASEGISFLGYRIFYDHILVRAKTLQRFQRNYKKKIKQYHQGILSKDSLERTKASFGGHLKHANSFGLKKSMFEKYLKV